MGLDMWLSTNSKKACRAAVEATHGSTWHAVGGVAIYWRKANAIHQWFVENVQYGEDDCKTYEVTVEQLKELRRACKKVLASTELVEVTEVDPYGEVAFPTRKSLKDTSVAEELLPTQEGFFFGSTQYDEYYWSELERTVKGIDAIIRNVERFEYHPWPDVTYGEWREKGEEDEWAISFEYHASW